jgi:bifunctional oligoribonuclease and PAP phosphatase NrnA
MISKLKLSEDEIKSAWQVVSSADKITLLTHSKPDADGISACAALEFVLLKSGKQYIETIYPDEPEFLYKISPKNVSVGVHKQVPDVVIVCDTSVKDRTYHPDDFSRAVIINIDHHEHNRIDATYNFVAKDVSSTCELLYVLFQKWVPDLLKEKYVAECLLSGILYDSQMFHTQNTYQSTLKIAAELVTCGASIYHLNQDLLSNKNSAIIKLWGNVLNNVVIEQEHDFAWCAISQEVLKKYEVDLTSLAGFSNFLAQLSEIDVTMIFYETKDGDTKVSLRSRNKDVNEFARKFGGGGHKNAAGIYLKKSLKNAVEFVISKMKKT